MQFVFLALSDPLVNLKKSFAKGAGSRDLGAPALFTLLIREEAPDRGDSKTLKLSGSISGRYQAQEPSCQGQCSLSSSSDETQF